MARPEYNAQRFKLHGSARRHKFMTRIVLAAVVTALLLPAAELPVREVVLYKHGVGYFERSGRLAPGESVRLDFNASEMNDVLKSLTLAEAGGGKIAGLRYDSMDPLSHKLAEFPFEISNDGLPGLLDRLRGARVELKLGAETIAGSIVNARTIPGTGRDPERDQLTLLLDSGDLRTVDLNAIAGLRFSDSKLQEQFRAYLGAVAAARSKDKRSVYIDSTGAAARDVRASYMIPSPVWKSSYRLIFGANGQPVLEGWAIVDNTTGEDWNRVNLSLVSGRPISFVTQLYPPKYVERPAAELADDNAARPILHAPAMAPPPPPPPPAPAARPRAQQQQYGGYGGVAGGVPGGVIGGIVSADAKAETGSSIVPENEARELGELFEYRVSQPVTIRRNESAMLPFLQQPIEGRKLLIYADHTSSHPTNAIQLNNSTGKTLDGGPITVYDAGAYGGEALMETLKAGDRRLISYAVDLGTRITEAFGSKQALVREIHAVRGVITTRLAAEEIRTYTIRNVDQKAKTLIIEHALRQGYTLLDQKPASKTSSSYRFEVPLAAGAMQEFKVSEERVFDESTAAGNLSPDTLLHYIGNRELSPAGRQQLQKIADQKRLVAENDQALRDVQAQIGDLGNEEGRIRMNIQTLISVREQQQLVQTYARQLDAAEQRLVGLRDRQAELQKKKTALQAELDGMVEAMAF
jgi:hypothetical protein